MSVASESVAGYASKTSPLGTSNAAANRGVALRRLRFDAGFGTDFVTDFSAGDASGDVIQFDANVFADFNAVLTACRTAGIPQSR